MAFVFWLLLLAVMALTVVDIVVREDGQIKHMPKALWLLLVILLPLVGVVLWFLIGREYPERVGRPSRPSRPSRGPEPPPPAPVPTRDTRTTEQQLADLEREIEQERRRAQLREQWRADRGPAADGTQSAEPSTGPSAS